MKIAIIDTEGIIVALGGPKSRRTTTVWTSDVAVIVYDSYEDTIVDSVNHRIKMPIPFYEASAKTRRQWTNSQKFSSKMWSSIVGISYQDSLKEIRKILLDCNEVWAKGKHIEVRFLNDLGMYGKGYVYKNRKPQDIQIFVNELNGIVKVKYDTAMYNFYKKLQKGRVTIIKGTVGDMVLRNYPRALPCIHNNPMRECHYFLSELLKYKNNMGVY
jgi:hypothetical protein